MSPAARLVARSLETLHNQARVAGVKGTVETYALGLSGLRALLHEGVGRKSASPKAEFSRSPRTRKAHG